MSLSVSEVLYGLYFLLLFGSKAWGLHEGFAVYKYILLLGIILYIIKELFTEKTIGEHLVSLILLVVALATYYYSGEKGLLLYFTMMLGMKGVSLKFIQRFALVVLGISFPLMYLISNTSYTWTAPVDYPRILMGVATRYDWGYPGPNVTHTTLIVLLALIIVNVEVKTIKQLVTLAGFLCLCSLYVYMYTVSYTGMIGCVVLIFSYLYLNIRKKLMFWEKGGIVSIYPLLGSISIGVPMLVSEDIFWGLDKIFHNRINFSRYFLTNMPITLFGNGVIETPWPEYYIDSAYIYSFLRIGLIPCIMVTGLFVCYMIYCLKKNKRSEIAIALSFAVIGLSDPFLYNLGYKNIMFIWYGAFLFEKIKEIKWINAGILGKIVSTRLTEFGKKELVFRGTIFDTVATFKDKIKEHFDVNGIWELFYFSFLWIIIMCIIMEIYGKLQMDGKIDTPLEWNLFHSYTNIAIIMAIGMIVLANSIHLKDKLVHLIWKQED